jgi:nucleotide-binding universal stress UspA family protein
MAGTRSGPVVIGFDGTPAAERALRESAALLPGRPALVVVVVETGHAFDLATVPATPLGPAAGLLDVRTAIDLEQAMRESAQRMAGWGATLAREAGMDAEGLAVADDITVADTLLRLVAERDASAVVVGAHRHGRLSELLLGSTSRSVIERAPCPVVVVRGD